MAGKKFSIEERVRWSDVDHAGIIYFGSYIRFFEIAETELYRAMGLPYGHAFDELDIYLVRAQFHSDFKAPAFLDDLLTAEIWVARVGTSSIDLRFEIVRKLSEKGKVGEVLVTGHCVLVTVRRATLRPCRIPDRLRRGLEEYLVPAT
ncbi:MAG TPA: thioesterase family protein [Candidatus Kapabacteria bacterium]|nr:thioesterase family protein [Candidatus Kapabacteria bacterium]